ncbi:MAG: hydroxyethylthiazole kinase [Acidaminococcus sp.]|jgi:hydroxyethylthiazole kinase|nr:hydroxyethylthiazole kinase [Acidaminococcus sp.]MCI2099939.1 hydroxyethylthiazole kinase [Acidaminococcus sp.]MCI2114170.1 hydroxyethylthiazole kinase [Acidaminococcus sp.]MCI2116346.1 hydroxyethylthiazole kinase [Acidaminococcus sp.]
MEGLTAVFTEISDAIRKRRPLVHHITNYVTAGFCADATLAVGASPMMADEPAEMDEIAPGADALVCNLGTLHLQAQKALLKAAALAKKSGIPVILDPVGVMSSSLRLDTAKAILATGCVAILKGNAAESEALLSLNGADGRGVDSKSAAHPETLAQALAEKYHCIAVVTGAADAISDGRRVVLARNGTPYLSRITGAGCMTGSLMGAAAAVTEDAMHAALWALTCMNVGAEKAETLCHGPGTFRAYLMDELSRHDGKDLAERFRGEEVKR